MSNTAILEKPVQQSWTPIDISKFNVVPEVESPIINIIKSRNKEYIQQAKQIHPVYSNRTSQMGYAMRCLRFGVYSRLNWENRKPVSDELQSIFLEGKEQEMVMERLFMEHKIRYYNYDPDQTYELKEYKITGHIDGFVEVTDDGKTYKMGADLKSSSMMMFPKINTIKDLLNPDYPYLRNYIVQVTLYMAMLKEKDWMLLFKDKNSIDVSPIHIAFNPELLEEALRTADLINQYVDEGDIIKKPFVEAIKGLDKEKPGYEEKKNAILLKQQEELQKVYPPRISYDPDICDRCEFAELCKPKDIFFEGMLDDHITEETHPEIVKDFNRMKELKNSLSVHDKEAKEFDKLKKKYKILFEDKTVLIADKFGISGKWVERSEYKVNASRYWKQEIQDLDSGAKI